jgi:hypothetical protein
MAETAEKASSLAPDGRTAFPLDPSDRDPRLQAISSTLLQLPPEIRYKIYGLAFKGNRVAVTAETGCHCASDTTGPYREDHRWLLAEAPERVRRDAKQAFTKIAMWELHCMNALDLFLGKLQALNALSYVRHIRVSVFETSREAWELPLDKLPCLKSITFSPWQKGWTIDIPEREDSPALSDASIMEEVHRVLGYKDGYEPVRNLINGKRDFKVYFVFPIRYLLCDDSRGGSRLKKWQLKTWRAACRSPSATPSLCRILTDSPSDPT